MNDANDRRPQGMAADELSENDRQLRLLVENMGDVISRHLPDSTFTYVSPSCRVLLGYTPEELVHTRAADYVHADEVQAVIATINHAAERHDEHYRVRHRMKRKDGRYIWVETVGRLSYGPGGHLHEIQCVARDITEGKQAEEALRIAKEFSENLLETANAIVITLNSEAGITTFNNYAEKLTGYKKAEAIGGNWFDLFIPPRDKEAVPKVFREGLQNIPDASRHENPIVTRSGEERLISWSNNVLRDSCGSIDGVLSIGIDITDRKRAEEALRQSEAKFRGLVESSGDWIWEVDVEGVYTYASPRVEAILGYKPEDVVGKTPFDLMPPEEAARVAELFKDAAGKGEPIVALENVSLHKDGRRIILETSGVGVLDTAGKVTGYRGVDHDITERRQTEEALRESEELHRITIESLSDAVFITKDDGAFTFICPNVAVIFGYSYDEVQALGNISCLLGQNLFDPAELAERRELRNIDRQVTDKRGEAHGLLVNVKRVSIKGGTVLCTCRDITERNRAQREREELIAKLEAQNAELERFAYTVSHDLKSPLITIQGYVGMLRQDLADEVPVTVRDDLARISSAADKMDQLLRDLLELSRIGRLINPPENVSLEEVAREALELVGGQVKERGVRVEISPDLPVVFGDRVRLLEVLQNLIDNAVKYMGDTSEPRVEIGSRRDGNQTICYVRDNGIGIEPRYHERVFGLFDQLDQKVEGSGIGLALVKRIVEVHGGRIWIESEGSGHGSTFCFTVAPNGQST
ncbi:MAG: PAS domain S-box protein [Planctomycetes bacterium]|nr:PAS domain S-box protein [Planctomycetota bacterium]